MAPLTDHGKVVLSRIVTGQGSLKALDYALARLSEDHFTDRVQRGLFRALTGYADQTRGIMPEAVLADILRTRPPGTRALYTEYYRACALGKPKDHEFRHSVDMLRKLKSEQATAVVLSQGNAIMNTTEGIKDEATGEILMGHEDARAFVLAGFADLEREAGQALTPEGNVYAESGDIMAEYARVKALRAKGEAPGVLFGIPELDSRLEGGLEPGELALIAAWTSVGKSSFCAQWAWHASVIQGRNVVYFTTEGLRNQVRIRLVARHSRHPKFGRDTPLNTADIRAGRLSEADEEFFREVLHDWQTGDYGICEVIQVPDNATVPAIGSRMAAKARQFDPHLAIVDYLQLFVPEKTRRDAGVHEDQSGIVQSAARLAASFGDHAGIPLVSPWQFNRGGREAMKAGGRPGIEHMSSTSEAGKAADVVLALLDREEDISEGRMVPLEAYMSKNRNGPKGFGVRLTADYACCEFVSRERAPDADVLELD
jgi:replicative DNA helicase